MRPSPSKPSRILVVEDEVRLAEMIKQNLETEGFEAIIETDGASALTRQSEDPSDLLILDVMLPRMNGFEVLRALRRRGDEVPVLILTARSDSEDRIQGLSFGADDYLGKPFAILELLARVRAILRRTAPREAVTQGRQVQSGPYRIDYIHFTVHKGRTDLEFSLREFRLLEVLLAHPGRVHTRQDLINLAWEEGARPTLRTIDKHIATLRRKLGDTGKAPVIQTLDREGYRWMLPVK